MESIQVHLPEDCAPLPDFVLELKTYIYRPGQDTQEVNGWGQLSSGDVLPGFTLDLATLG